VLSVLVDASLGLRRRRRLGNRLRLARDRVLSVRHTPRETRSHQGNPATERPRVRPCSVCHAHTLRAVLRRSQAVGRWPGPVIRPPEGGRVGSRFAVVFWTSPAAGCSNRRPQHTASRKADAQSGSRADAPGRRLRWLRGRVGTRPPSYPSIPPSSLKSAAICCRSRREVRSASAYSRSGSLFLTTRH
jgi:hypothetical protein